MKSLKSFHNSQDFRYIRKTYTKTRFKSRQPFCRHFVAIFLFSFFFPLFLSFFCFLLFYPNDEPKSTTRLLRTKLRLFSSLSNIFLSCCDSRVFCNTRLWSMHRYPVQHSFLFLHNSVFSVLTPTKPYFLCLFQPLPQTPLIL